MNPIRKAAIAAAVVGATVTGGAIGASFIGSASAQEATVDSSTTVDSTAPVSAADTSTPAVDASSPAVDGSSPAADASGAPAGRHGGGGPGGDPSKGGHQANGITETILTGDDATKVTATATAAVPGATVDRVETDAEGASFEAHVTKADGSKVTVKVNADYSVASVEDGMK